MEKFKIIGLMSGTSLDGLDIAFCEFYKQNNRWEYILHCAETIEYHERWKNRFKRCENESGLYLIETHKEFGSFCAEQVNLFCKKNAVTPDFISSHGHTIFHQPHKNITLQLGCGATIAALTNCTTVCDFRSTDVALGGQGAPLVPIGDELLFSKYDYCLNIGGFANISYHNNGSRSAYDICAANIVLNHLSEKTGHAFDKGGQIASSGTINPELLNKLNLFDFYHQNGPKSLGKEWVLQNIIPLLDNSALAVNDLLATFTQHIAEQIAKQLKPNTRTLITGGGVYNSFLIEKIKKLSPGEIIIPDDLTIQFKEALIFAFLGVLRITENSNSLKSVTGASRNSCGGAVYLK